jgi:hypothetical protein
MTSSLDAAVVVLHEPTSKFLGAGLVLRGRDEAVSFENVDTAERFLARHASEPCFTVVATDDSEGRTAA